MSNFIVSHIVLFVCSNFLIINQTHGTLLPPMGWSSWNSVRYQVNDSYIRESAHKLSLNLSSFGYNYILIDDGWPKCLEFDSENKHCINPAPRNTTTDYITIDSDKFPHGFKSLTSYVHSLKLKIGIYTAVSNRTCGGFTGSLGFEMIDAKSFVEWGFDFVKHDTCNHDCGSQDGCIQNSTYKMGSYLQLYNDQINNNTKKIIYYVDDGNPTTNMRLWNPNLYNCASNGLDNTKIALHPSQQIFEFVIQAPFYNSKTNESVVNMFKSWYDRSDNWFSVLDNLHRQIGLQMYQKCGIFNMPDMLTTNQGGMTFSQYRAEFLLYTVLGTPIIFGATLDQLLSDSDIYSLITNKEIIAVNQDSDCTQGSMLRMESSYEIWGKPLNDSSVVVVVVNKDEKSNVNVVVNVFGYEGDFYPMFLDGAKRTFYARDLVQGKELGKFNLNITVEVEPMDAMMIKLYNFANT